MLNPGERDDLQYYLKMYCRCNPNEEFWKKAAEHGLHSTFYAIRKAAQEQDYSLQHIIDIIGQVVKEGNSFVYKQGFPRPVSAERIGMYEQALYDSDIDFLLH